MRQTDDLAHWDCWGSHGSWSTWTTPCRTARPRQPWTSCSPTRSSSSGRSPGKSGAGKRGSSAPTRTPLSAFRRTAAGWQRV